MGFSENLKRVRKEHKITQNQLAEELGLCRSAIAKYETSEILPNAKNIRKICNMFDISFDDLFSE